MKKTQAPNIDVKPKTSNLEEELASLAVKQKELDKKLERLKKKRLNIVKNADSNT